MRSMFAGMRRAGLDTGVSLNKLTEAMIDALLQLPPGLLPTKEVAVQRLGLLGKTYPCAEITLGLAQELPTEEFESLIAAFLFHAPPPLVHFFRAVAAPHLGAGKNHTGQNDGNTEDGDKFASYSFAHVDNLVLVNSKDAGNEAIE